jgi:general secretion pathway protein G
MNDPIKNPSLDFENSVNDFACSKSLNRNGCNRGFTLIEVFIVIAIIGCISAIALPNYLRYKNNAMIAVAVTNIRMIEKQISLFAFDNDGQLPDILNDLTTIGTINDPWGNPYEYLRIAGGDVKKMGEIRRNMIDVPVNQDYDLYSMGKDGQSQSSFKVNVSWDDVVRAYEGRYVGLVSEL